MNTYTINDRKLAYLDHGEGPAILFGHSYLWDHTMWAAQIEELSRNHRCIAVDLWGHGASGDIPADDCTLDRLADDHYQLMQHLRIDRFSIAGLSIGGMWGLRLALAHPETVKSIALLGTDAGSEPMDSRQLYLGMLQIIEQTKVVPDAVIEKIGPGFLAPKTIAERPELLQAFKDRLAAWPTDKLPSVVAVGRSFVNRTSVVDRLSELTMPALVVVGQDDAYRPITEAQQMADNLPNVQLEIVQDAGHISTIDQPRTIANLLDQFFTA